MNRAETWKNFDLGMELAISGSFIFNGLRRFHEMRTLDRTEDVFECLYNLAVGCERTLKVALVLLEHDGSQSQAHYEDSLRTHNHVELLRRVRERAPVHLGSQHNRFLELLSTFYKSLRYDRFTLSPTWNPDKEKVRLHAFFEKSLGLDLEPQSPLLGTPNRVEYKAHLGKIVGKISTELFRVVQERATELNLYTYELRSGSRAETVFLGGQCEFATDDILWKELLLFFMNSESDGGLLGFMKSIEPLDFDDGLVEDYLRCFQSEEAKAEVVGELEALYSELEDPKERIDTIALIGNPDIFFDGGGEEESEEGEAQDN